MFNFTSIHPFGNHEEDDLLIKGNSCIRTQVQVVPKRKIAKRKVTTDDIKAAGLRGNESFNYFLENGKLPFSR